MFFKGNKAKLQIDPTSFVCVRSIVSLGNSCWGGKKFCNTAFVQGKNAGKQKSISELTGRSLENFAILLLSKKQNPQRR